MRRAGRGVADFMGHAEKVELTGKGKSYETREMLSDCVVDGGLGLAERLSGQA